MKTDDNTIDVGLSIVVLVFATLIAGGHVETPPKLLQSTQFAVILIIGSLLIFALYPMVGFALFFLIAVLLFKRNILTTIDLAKNNFNEFFTNKKGVNENFHPNITERRNPMEWKEHFDPNVTERRNPMEWREHYENQGNPDGIPPPKAGPHLVVSQDKSNPNSTSLQNGANPTYASVATPPPMMPKLVTRTDAPYVETHPQTEDPEILNTGNTVYGINSIVAQKTATPLPFSNIHSQPRLYKDFSETNKQNRSLGPIVEGYQPANLNDLNGSSVEGQYQIELTRAFEVPEERGFAYYPNSETGTNNFVRTPSKLIDEKMMPLKY